MRSAGVRSGMLVAIVLAFTFVTASQALAGDSENELGFVLGAGFGDKDLVGDTKDSDANLLGGLRFAHIARENLGVFGDLIYVPYQGEGAYGDVSEYAGRAGLEWYMWGRKWRTYLAPALGLAVFSPHAGGQAMRPIGSLGFGQRRPTDSGAFRWEIRAEQTAWDSGLNGDNFLNYQAFLGYAWGVGGPPKDTDGDGVPDRKDKCPGTPAGALVDENGCPKDTDGDGVLDGLDQCPDTPPGCKVDARGCPVDTDGDGVADCKDNCADTPRGARVDAKGCPSDTDGDGVWDGLDQCPDTKKGCKVDAKGCPLDGDRDGVCDGLDECPNSAAGATVDAKGCEPPKPKPAPLFTPEKKSLVLEGVNFEYDKDELTPGARQILDGVAESLLAWPDVDVEVQGHTDARGADAYNLKLSDRRAKAVLDYLASKGVPASRMISKGFGEKQPIADNKTDEGRARNRRVELRKTN